MSNTIYEAFGRGIITYAGRDNALAQLKEMEKSYFKQ